MTRRQSGFTLIEITVVVAIIGLMVGGTTMGLRALARTELRRAVSELAGAMRFAFDRAATSGRFYRLAFDFGKREVALEESETQVTVARDEREERRNQAEEPAGAQAGPAFPGLGGDPFAPRVRAAFQPFAEAGFKPVRLGKAELRSVWTPRFAEPATEGAPSLYYFAQGYAEEAVVVLGDGDAVFSLRQHPLTGKVRVLPYRYEIERGQGERDDLGERLP